MKFGAIVLQVALIDGVIFLYDVILSRWRVKALKG